jgi:hypothetical protein
VLHWQCMMRRVTVQPWVKVCSGNITKHSRTISRHGTKVTVSLTTRMNAITVTISATACDVLGVCNWQAPVQGPEPPSSLKLRADCLQGPEPPLSLKLRADCLQGPEPPLSLKLRADCSKQTQNYSLVHPQAHFRYFKTWRSVPTLS